MPYACNDDETLPIGSKPKATHTPGPWKASIAVRDNSPSVYIIHQPKWGAPSLAELNEGEHANARLIAAAPELLEIAKAYRNFLRCAAHTDGEVATFHHIESIISKATVGES